MAVALAALPLAATAQGVAPGLTAKPDASPLIRLAQAGPVAPDERFWSTIQNSSLPDLFEMFIKRYPDSALRPQAEARLAALKGGEKSASAEEQAGSMLRQDTRATKPEAEAEPRPETSSRLTTGSTPPTRSATQRPAPPVTDARAPVSFPTRSEIMVIQAELLRVGCLGDTVDGIWGPKTQAAAAQFASSAGLDGQVARPGMAILDALRKTPGQVCTRTASVPAAEPRAEPVRRAPARAPTTSSARPAPKRTASQPAQSNKNNWAKEFLELHVDEQRQWRRRWRRWWRRRWWRWWRLVTPALLASHTVGTHSHAVAPPGRWSPDVIY